MFWENILEVFLVLIVGLTGVLTVLFLFYLIIEGVNKLEYLLVENQKKKAERAKAANSIVSSENEEDLIAILTAAASVTLSGKIKIKQIRFIKSQPVSPWATLGRMNLISSHNIQKNQ